MVKVELVYITQDGEPFHVNLDMLPGACVRDAVNASEIFDKYPETSGMSLGIFSKPVSLDTLLKNGDRIELYRPLVRDPKEKRRRLASKRKKA